MGLYQGSRIEIHYVDFSSAYFSCFVILYCSNTCSHLGYHLDSSLSSGIGRMRPKERLHNRRKRQASGARKYLEVLIAADTSVTAIVGKDKIETYLLSLMNIVSQTISELLKGFCLLFVSILIYPSYENVSFYVRNN